MVSKLRNSKVHLESILSISEWVTPPSTSTSGATGSSISTTNVSLPTFDISGNLDNFFGNLLSAFDIFAQVTNLVYLTPPLNESDVSFDRVVNEMACGLQNEVITQYLLSVQRSQWYKNQKAFRRCAIHRKSIPFTVTMEFAYLQTSSFPKVTAVLLPDNPYLKIPTYQKKQEMRVFGMNIFQNTLNAIDDMYGIMEVRVRAADRIPI